MTLYRDLSPPNRLWECDWLVIDLEHVVTVRKAIEDDEWNGVIVYLTEDEWEIEDVNEAASFLAAWKAYRGCALRSELARPPRTGYRDEDGVHHPPPDARDYNEHADGCARCDEERRRSS
jgi:hypothetical protein